MTNPNSGESAIINFQPMPKRFLIWDKNDSRFLTMEDAYPKCQLSDDERDKTIFGMQDLVALFSETLYYDSSNDYVVCQSTNLFDQNGKEIFEGSILEQDLTNCRANRKYHYLVQSVPHWGAGWMPVPIDGGKSWPALVPNTAKCLKNVGHILSNPELVEEKCVSTAKK